MNVLHRLTHICCFLHPFLPSPLPLPLSVPAPPLRLATLGIVQGLLTLLGGGREASVPSQPHQRVGNADRTKEEWRQDLCRDSQKATAAAAVVRFVGACLDLLSVSPVGGYAVIV